MAKAKQQQSVEEPKPVEGIVDDVIAAITPKNVDWRKVLSHLDFESAALEIAKATDTPVDDFLVDQISEILRAKLLDALSPPPMYAAEPLTAEQVQETYRAYGAVEALSPMVVDLLLTFAAPRIFELLQKFIQRRKS